MPGPATTHEDLSIPVWGASLAARRIRLPHAAPKAPIVFLHDCLGCITAWRDFPDCLCAAAGREGLVYDREEFARSSPQARPRTPSHRHDEADIPTAVILTQSETRKGEQCCSVRRIVGSRSPCRHAPSRRLKTRSAN